MVSRYHAGVRREHSTARSICVHWRSPKRWAPSDPDVLGRDGSNEIEHDIEDEVDGKVDDGFDEEGAT